MLNTAFVEAAQAKVRPIEALEPPKTSLFDVYNRYFKTVPVNSTALHELFYRLRYQVYCVENPFEDKGRHPEGLEIDEFDNRSVSSLLVHVPTGLVAGGIRVILPGPDRGPRDLPVWRVCDPEAYANREKHLPRERTAEVSRIAVSKEFRQHCASKVDYGEAGSVGRTIMTQLSVGLLGAVLDRKSVV